MCTRSKDILQVEEVWVPECDELVLKPERSTLLGKVLCKSL